MSENEWVRAAQAATMLGVSRERVRQLLKKGLLKGRRVKGRVCRITVASIHARLASPLHGSSGAGTHPANTPKRGA